MIDYKFQNQGLGKASFQQILKDLENQGVRKVIIMLDDTNTKAKNLYTSFGFRFTGKIEKMSTITNFIYKQFMNIRTSDRKAGFPGLSSLWCGCSFYLRS